MLHHLRGAMNRARRKRRVGVAVVLTALLTSIVGNALTFYLFESGKSIGDSFWYSAISITTIGYGDLSANTVGARIGTIVFITLLGLTAFTAWAGMVINWLMELQHKYPGLEQVNVGATAMSTEQPVILEQPEPFDKEPCRISRIRSTSGGDDVS